MGSQLQALRTARHWSVKALEWTVIGLMVILVLDVLWGVFSRYILGAQSVWTEELARMLLIWVSLLGASVGFDKKAHLGLDYFVGKLHPDAQKMVSVFSLLLVIFFAVSIFIVGGLRVTLGVYTMEVTMFSLPLGKAWMYAVLPITGVFMVLFSVEQIIEIVLPKEEDE